MTFSQHINVLFANPLIAQAATYTPEGGEPVAVRVVRSAPRQQEWGAFQTGASVTPHLYDVRVAEVAEPRDGDVLEVEGNIFTVRSYEKDEEQLVWRLNLDKA